MTAPVRRGYLLIADISGFTAFLADAELDHGQAVLEQVLGRLIESLTPTLRFVEVEGDAVFVYGLREETTRGELIAELVEATYASFRDLKTDMLRNATCPCRACQNISALDLKFVVHYGEFVIQELAGKRGPVGSDVNLAHRLLKNDVSDQTGWRAYALYSEAALAAMDLPGAEMHRSEAEYEHLGSVATYATDLNDWYECALACRRFLVAAPDAHVELVHETDQPAPIVWDWLNDPEKRSRWMARADWSAGDRPDGRTGANANNHCATFKVIEQVLDWKPFDYYTIRLVAPSVKLLATVKLEPGVDGTRIRWRLALESMLPGWAASAVIRLLLRRRMRLRQGLEEMSRLMAADRTTAREGVPD